MGAIDNLFKPASEKSADLGGTPPAPESDFGGAWLKAAANLSVALGAHTAELRAARTRAQAQAEKLRYAPIQPIVQTPVAGAILMQSSELWGPKTGYFWAIQRTAAFGLSPGGDTSSSQGSVTSPAANAAITSMTGLTPGTYTVSVLTTTGGTTGAPELNNFRLTGLADGAVTSIPLNSAAGSSVANTATVVVGPAGTLTVTAGATAPTVGAVYTADLSIVSTADSISLFRGQPQPQNFLNSLTASSPEWRPGAHGALLQPGDFLTVSGAGVDGVNGAPIAVNFDCIIGTLDILADYLD
jgi:hypothetical protein